MAADVLREMQLFTPRYLVSDQPDVQCSDINKLCKFYEMDETNESSELAELRSVCDGIVRENSYCGKPKLS